MALVRWMELKRLRFSHIPQETFIPGPARFAILGKNKRMGVRKGVPDYIIMLPGPGKDLQLGYRLLFIEMKRKGRDKTISDIKPEQKEWIDALNLVPGVKAMICFGYDAAVAAIESAMKSAAEE